MDIDIAEDMEMAYALEASQAQASSSKSSHMIITVDDAHPFDLDAYISGYAGRAAIDRLIHIIAYAPSLAPQALARALELLVAPGQYDTSLYQALISAYDAAPSLPEGALPAFDELIADQSPYIRWLEETTARNQLERTRLEVELKTYTNNMIKESIRMAHRDLGAYYRSTGNFEAALRHHTKSREFCTTSQHMLDMCLSVLELLLEQRNFAHIPTYIFKAESAVDSMSSSTQGSTSATATATATGSSAKKSEAMRAVEAKLSLCSALSHLSNGNYSKAAQAFLAPSPPGALGSWTGTLLAAGDVGVYATLCALATMGRMEVKRKVMEGDGLATDGEGMKALLEAWMASRFRVVLELLDRYSARHMLDPLLAPHIANLTSHIRARALVLYFQPFATIRLERMSAAFGWTVKEMEKEVVSLIQRGEILGRVDSQNKILKARSTDPRAQLYAHALKAGADMQSATRKLLLRMQLQQADLVVRKAQTSGGQAPMEFLSEM
ncbi:hypothetical protein BV25DRAFT_1807315 [Artomyces pyxidatus]|uniref:Uncharacterized protein n=1 Tax=Artomyces pyxidatus TaxID=48021 RepID=A0ACB8SX31_9AGAM|nr:hypothetical protein BV25DRAFT_1807315 [Artomyces pyxidatus]